MAGDPQAGAVGYVDRITLGGIDGWAYAGPSADGTPLRVSAYFRDEMIGESEANVARPDVAHLTQGNAACGFHIGISPPYDIDEIEVKAGGRVLPVALQVGAADFSALTGSLYHYAIDWPANGKPLAVTVPLACEHDLDICKRLVEVYSRLFADSDEAFAGASSMWAGLLQSNFRNLVAIVRKGDAAELLQYLSWMHKRPETWGISQGPDSYFLLKNAPPESDAQRVHAALYTSELLALAEYLAVIPVENLNQGAINTVPDPAQIMRGLHHAIGFDPAFPHKLGGMFCVDTGAGLVQQRDVWALYTALRAADILRGQPGARICEIGGGLGQVCYYAAALGFSNYTLIDLPHVSLLQAFQLMRLFPEKKIALYEGGGFDVDAEVRIYPTFMFERAPDNYFALTLNVDSLPEMGWINALAYAEAARKKSARFLSINQEAAAPLGFAGESQIRVPDVFARAGMAKPEYRFRSWVRRGYIETLWDLSSATTRSQARIDGYLDSVDPLWIAGWVHDAGDRAGDGRVVDINSDGKPLGSASASQFWQALLDSGIGDGRHGFTMRTPIDLFDGEPHEVTAFDRLTGFALKTSPKSVHFPDIRPLGPRIAETLKTDIWMIDSFAIERGVLSVTGWALAPSGDAAAATFRVNGENFDSVTWPVGRRDIHQCYFYHPGSHQAGFALRTDISRFLRAGASELALSFAHAKSNEPLTHYQTYYHPLIEETFPLPDGAQRKRVTGTDNEFLFRLGGFTLYRKIVELLSRRFPSSLHDGANVLDWGCGCGRLLRYLAADNMRLNLHGADIDPDNIGWCKTNLPSIKVEIVPLSPPTPYAAGQFNLVIGNSVFTHLGEKQQLLWLEELSRITTSGGLVMVSVQAASELPRETFFAPEFEKLFEKGFLSSSVDDALAEVIDDATYYRSAFHTHDYVRSVWSKYFEVVDIVPQFANNVQDWVIMRKT